jgi:tetratricopeptide (TPR) repeat protein
MPKGMADADAPESGLTDLRADIRELEITASNLRGKGARVLDVLRLRDSVQGRFDALVDRGMDLRPEQTRLETIDNMIRRQGGLLGRELAESGGIEAARAERRPPEDYWWWFVDIEHAQHLRKTAIRYGAIIVGALILILVGNYVLTQLYGLSPLEKQAESYASRGEQLAQQGDLAGAIVEYEAANEVFPSASNYVWLSALYETLGETARAAEALAAAETLVQDRRAIYASLARNHDLLGNLDASEAWAYRLLALDNDYAQAWLYLGAVAEARGNTESAIKFFEEAARLASEQNDNPLYVLARMRMGMLMGGGASGPSGAGF